MELFPGTWRSFNNYNSDLYELISLDGFILRFVDRLSDQQWLATPMFAGGKAENYLNYISFEEVVPFYKKHFKLKNFK